MLDTEPAILSEPRHGYGLLVVVQHKYEYDDWFRIDRADPLILLRDEFFIHTLLSYYCGPRPQGFSYVPARDCLSGTDTCSCRIAGSAIKFTDADGKTVVYRVAEWSGEHGGWPAAWPD